MSHRSPARRAAHGHLPNLSGSPGQALSPYRKAAAKQSQLRGSSWKSVALPDIPGMSGPVGPADGPLSPDPMFQAKESKALSTWMQAAQNGDAEAQNNLGVSYYRGINGVQKSAQLASTWWIRAAAQGFAEAQYNLAVCMLHGKGVAKDETGAARMLKGAAEQDHAEAICMLASLHSDGLAGFKENKQDALALYTTAAGLGSDEAKYKKLVLEDLVARETELEALQQKIGKINDGFIQLQLERAANEEVTHAYKGAGFFLSNMKSETPARARIEQAKRAEQEIQKLRHQIVEKEQKTQSFAQQVDAGKHEVQELLERIAILEQASDGAAGRMEALNSKCKQLEASENQLKNQVKDLLAENTELRSVADWAKNQRVEALKQALSSVVKTTISEQNEREKMLRTELQNIRKQLAQATAAAASTNGGQKVALPEETPDDSGAFLKRVRRDMLMQEIFLKEILTGMRHEGDYHEHVEFLKEAVSVADQGEKLFQGACEEILDRVDSGTEELTDDETINLREALKRILKSIEDKKRPESASRLNTATQKAATELDDIRNNVARISEIMIDMMSSPGPPSEGQKKEIIMLQQGVSEVAAKFAGHRDEVHEHVQAGKVDKRYLNEHPALDKDIEALHQNLQLLAEGKPLSAEAKAEMLKIQQTNQTPAASRIGTAGSRSKGQRDVGGQFRPPSASRATMTEAGRRSSRSPTGAKGLHSPHGNDIASSPVNFGSPHAVDSSVTLQVIQDSIAKLADQAGGQSAERLDEAFKHVNKRLDKVLGAVRGDHTPSSSRPITPVHGWVVGEDGERRFTRGGTKGSDAGSQVDESEFLKHSATPGLRWVEVGTEQPAGGTELNHDGLAEALQLRDEFTLDDLQEMKVTGLTFDHWIKVRDKFFKPAPEARAPGRRTRHSTRRDDHRGDHSHAEHGGQGGAALADERIARARAEMDLQIAEYKSKIEILESEKRQVEFEKNALEAELRLANNEVKRTNMELDANKKNLEQQIAFEKAMLRDEIKAAHDDADKARAERDKSVSESTALVNHMENELERKREAFEDSAKKINEANQESMRDVMESFASKVAVHLSVIRSEEGGGGGGGASEELMADIAKQIDSVKKDMAVKNEGLVEMLQELDTTLKINSKRMSRSSMGSRGGDATNAGDAVRNGSHPGVTAPLPPEEMDAIKSDLHFAVAGAMRNVLDEHKNGVVLLNMPDHNKPAGFMHGDGAGLLHSTMQQNMREQRQLHSQLADDMEQIRMRFSKLEEKMNIQLSSVQQSAGADVVKKEAKSTTKLLYAVQADNGSQSGIESRLLPSLEQDALSESVDEMKELLQSWYRSFSFVSRLQHAVKH